MKQDIEQFIDYYRLLESHIEFVTGRIGHYYEDGCPPAMSKCVVDFTGDDVVLEWTEDNMSMGYCNTEVCEMRFPKRFLWMITDDVIKELEENQTLEKERQSEAERLVSESINNAEYQQYIVLKQKFEGS